MYKTRSHTDIPAKIIYKGYATVQPKMKGDAYLTGRHLALSATQQPREQGNTLGTEQRQNSGICWPNRDITYRPGLDRDRS